jgi:hypothetical protein
MQLVRMLRDGKTYTHIFSVCPCDVIGKEKFVMSLKKRKMPEEREGKATR